jgi:hypothetical protein
MKKAILITGLCCLTSLMFHLQAQTINNRNWKTFIADPLNDTLTFHFRSDTSFVTNGMGETILQTNARIVKDTLTLSDYGTGQYSCPDTKGVYKINLQGSSFTLILLGDPCEGRAHALDGIKWNEVK